MKKRKHIKNEGRIAKSVEAGEWKEVPNGAAERSRFQSYAQHTLRKNKRMNVRISEHDLLLLQQLAEEEGIPYQTLITSVLHKYIRGRFVERKYFQK